MDLLRERRIPLEVCPTSNVCLGIVESMEQHPIRALIDAGLVVTVNADDPPMFSTSLTGEYLALHTRLGFTVDEVEQLTLNAVRVSYLPLDDRTRMEEEFVAEFARLRDAHL